MFGVPGTLDAPAMDGAALTKIVVLRSRIDRLVVTIGLVAILALLTAGWVWFVGTPMPTMTQSVTSLPHPTPDPHPMNDAAR